MTIYEELVQRVDNGDAFSIDFEKRTMKVGRQKLIDNGEYDDARKLIDFDGYVLKTIYELYQDYKYSLPSERSDKKRRKYFKALSVDELTDEQLATGQKREVAQAALEGFVLCSIIAGHLVWDEAIMGKWFYQRPSDPDLVILRSWIEDKNN